MGKLSKSIGIAGAVAGAAGAAFLSKSKNREKVKRLVTGGDKAYVKKLGRPGAYSEPEDAKMVDEGALTSVQYYNKLQDDPEKAEPK
jgi:hypothetical protein